MVAFGLAFLADLANEVPLGPSGAPPDLRRLDVVQGDVALPVHQAGQLAVGAEARRDEVLSALASAVRLAPR